MIISRFQSSICSVADLHDEGAYILLTLCKLRSKGDIGSKSYLTKKKRLDILRHKIHTFNEDLERDMAQIIKNYSLTDSDIKFWMDYLKDSYTLADRLDAPPSELSTDTVCDIIREVEMLKSKIQNDKQLQNSQAPDWDIADKDIDCQLHGMLKGVEHLENIAVTIRQRNSEFRAKMHLQYDLLDDVDSDLAKNKVKVRSVKILLTKSLNYCYLFWLIFMIALAVTIGMLIRLKRSS